MKIKKIFTSDNFLIMATAAFFLLLCLSPNNKIFAALFLILPFVLLPKLKSLELAFFYTYVLSTPFAKIGKTYEIFLVSPAKFRIEGLNGIGLPLVFSAQEVLSIIVLIFIARKVLLKKIKPTKPDLFGVFLTLYFVGRLLASLWGSIRPEISLFLALQDSLVPVLIYFQYSLLEKKPKQLEKIFFGW